MSDIIIRDTTEEIVIVMNKQGPAGVKGPAGDGDGASGEVPSGVIDGVNLNFVLANTPTNTVKLYQNGIRLKQSIDHGVIGNIITFVTPPVPGDLLLADYSY